MKVLQVLHLTCHAKRASGAPSAAPAMQSEAAPIHHSSPDFCRPLCRCSMCCLPRKRSLRCSRRCAYHAKRASGALSAAPATQNDAAPIRITRRRTSADLYEGAPSAAPARQNEPEMLQVLRLPRKTSRRCSKCCACHAKPSAAQSNQSSPDFCGAL